MRENRLNLFLLVWPSILNSSNSCLLSTHLFHQRVVLFKSATDFRICLLLEKPAKDYLEMICDQWISCHFIVALQLSFCSKTLSFMGAHCGTKLENFDRLIWNSSKLVRLYAESVAPLLFPFSYFEKGEDSEQSLPLVCVFWEWEWLCVSFFRCETFHWGLTSKTVAFCLVKLWKK